MFEIKNTKLVSAGVIREPELIEVLLDAIEGHRSAPSNYQPGVLASIYRQYANPGSIYLCGQK